MDEISTTVDQIVHSIRTKDNNRRRKNRRRVQTLIDQFEKFDISLTPEEATDLGKKLSENDELQEVLRSFVDELNVGLLLDFISDYNIKKSKGKQKAASGKAKTPKIQEQEKEPLKSSAGEGSSRSVYDTRKRLSCAPDQVVSKISDGKKDPSKNTWNLPMADFSRDEIMSYLDRYLKVTELEILKSIYNHEPTFIQMVSTAVKYWDDQQLIDFLLIVVEEVLEKSTEETNRWLVNNKVLLAVVLIACFQEGEDILERVMKIICVATYTPTFIQRGEQDNDMVEEIMLMTHFVLLPSKRVHVQTTSLAHIISAIGYMTLWMEIYNKEEVKNVKRWMAKKGIIDVIVDFHSKPLLYELAPKVMSIIITVGIFLTHWVKEEVKATSILPIVPSILEYLNDPQFNETSPFGTQSTPSIIIEILCHLIQQLKYEQMMRLLSKDVLDKIMSAVCIHPTREHEMLDIFAVVVQKVPLKELNVIPDHHRQKLDDMMEHMVKLMKQHALPSNNLIICLTQLFITTSVFMNASKQLCNTMIDDGTFLMMIETLMKAEDLKITDNGKTKLRSCHMNFIAKTIQYFLTTVELMIAIGGQAIMIKIAKVIKLFLPKISSMLPREVSESTIPYQQLIEHLTLNAS